MTTAIQFVSTRGTSPSCSFADAVLQGQPTDGGLFAPSSFPQVSKEQMQAWQHLSFAGLANKLTQLWLETEFPEVFSFPLPLVQLTPQHAVLELFHGPTLSFKDVGARFLAACLKRFIDERQTHATIVTATSGDTGSAVADAFCGHDRLQVFVFYPQGRISEVQRHQIALKRKNVFPIALEGSFDDCQAVVKKLLADKSLQHKNLSSANSINIGRLLAQTFYYAWVSLQYLGQASPIIVVPSGNFGNVTAGLFAQKIGFPLHLLAACNANRVVLDYYLSGKYQAAASQPTFSSAMDVGNPSNFERIRWLFNDELSKIKVTLPVVSVSDVETLQVMRDVWSAHKYQLDPHGAVAWKAAQDLLTQGQANHVVSLATAHPSKFSDAVQQACGVRPVIPESLQKQLQQEVSETVLPNDYETIRDIIRVS